MPGELVTLIGRLLGSGGIELSIQGQMGVRG